MASLELFDKSWDVASAPIARVALTSDTLSDRGGLALFSRYARHLDIFPVLEQCFGALRKSGKGLPVSVLLHQLFCFLADGTSRYLVHFDALKRDEGYARGIETAPELMASSHQIKRFFGAFRWGRIWIWRRVLRRLFLWRLKLERPDVVVLGLDTMVMDNDEALKREGCTPTYKKVKGFQPLQMTWGPFIVDALFRGGKKHGNAGEAAGRLVETVVHFIRQRYRADVPIVLRLDSGFFDKKLLRRFEALRIGYVCSGRLEDDVIEMARTADASAWKPYDNGRQIWQILEFGAHRPTWKRREWRRALYTRPLYEGEQQLLAFARPDNLLYTNLGQGGAIDRQLATAGRADWTEPERILELYHGRGRDELVHRALKDFRAEELPFRSFQANAAFYYTVLVGFFLFESFKRDVSHDIVPVTAQATRVRREIIDFAAKIVRHAQGVVLKVSAAVCHRLDIERLWDRAAHPPPFAWA